jgi:hypothetical protein
MIVDGPPGATGPQARYPALPALLQAIPSDPARPLQITLLLDDMIRADEQATAAAWQALPPPAASPPAAAICHLRRAQWSCASASEPLSAAA